MPPAALCSSTVLALRNGAVSFCVAGVQLMVGVALLSCCVVTTAGYWKPVMTDATKVPAPISGYTPGYQADHLLSSLRAPTAVGCISAGRVTPSPGARAALSPKLPS